MNEDDDQVNLLIDGKSYGGWLGMRVGRAITRMTSHFDLTVSDTWSTQTESWPILPFMPCEIRVAGQTIITGFVDSYVPSIGGSISVTGRSKTMDLIDCMPDIAGGQYNGYTMAAIARAVSAPFGVEVIASATTADIIIADATIDRCETSYDFLARLGKLNGVLLTDDPQGRLVLVDVGTAPRAAPLVEGQNLLGSTHATLSGAKRFSRYVVKGQAQGGGEAADTWAGVDGVGEAAHDGPVNTALAVHTGLQAVALDPAVPRFRQHVSMAESQLDAAGMQRRVNWMAALAAGNATKLNATVAGWRQSPGGPLWQTNALCQVHAPSLTIIDQDLLIVDVVFSLTASGRTTELTLGPISGFTPDPGAIKSRHKKKGKGGSAPSWDGISG